MATRELTPSEREFTVAMLDFMHAVETLRTSAAKVKANGGDIREAFLALGSTTEERAALAGQWPMLSLMLAGA